MHEYRYIGVRAGQSNRHQVVTFSATASEVASFASIDRMARDGNGALRGFQRPQIASHIQEIRDYLRRDDAVLPNAIVIAFTDGIKIEEARDGLVKIEIRVEDSCPGVVVDGQQRLSALLGLDRTEFEVFVSALVCSSVEELRRQFILINNTRPLPKSLIYELLPTVAGLPPRLSARSFAAALTEQLNFDDRSSLKGQILQHTNPSGVIRDTALQRAIMNSSADGALRELMHFPGGEEKSFSLLSDFYGAVQETFPDEWHGHKPKTSRLVHGAGIIAMGYVMEVLYARDGARTRGEFAAGLLSLKGRTAWTRGSWRYSGEDVRPWNSIQNVNREILQLADHLIRIVKRSGKEGMRLVAGDAADRR